MTFKFPSAVAPGGAQTRQYRYYPLSGGRWRVIEKGREKNDTSGGTAVPRSNRLWARRQQVQQELMLSGGLPKDFVDPAPGGRGGGRPIGGGPRTPYYEKGGGRTVGPIRPAGCLRGGGLLGLFAGLLGAHAEARQEELWWERGQLYYDQRDGVLRLPNGRPVY